MATGTLEKLAGAVGGALADLETQLRPDEVIFYFHQLGALFPEALSTAVDFSNAAAAAAGLRPLLGDLATAEAANDTAGILLAGAGLIPQLALVFDALDDVAGEINAQAASWAPLSVAEVNEFTNGLALRVLSNGLLRRLEAERPEYAHALVLLGLADRFRAPAAGAKPNELPIYSRRLRLERVADALSSPSDYLRGLVGWGDAGFEPTALLQRIEAFLNLFTHNTVIDTSGGSPVLEASLLTVRGNDTISPPGIDLTFNIPIPGLELSTPVRPGYSVGLSIVGGVPEGVTVTAAPPSRLSVAAPVSLRVDSSLTRAPFGAESAVVLLGQTGATRLEADSVRFAVGLELAASGAGSSGDVFFRMEANGARAVFDFSSGDGFITSLTGGGDSAARFDLAATWSVAGGLRFEAGGGLELQAPLHLQLGPIEILDLYLSLAVRDGGFPLELSAGLRATLGPATLVVDRLGFRGTLSFPEAPARGNLGPLDLDVGFKAPSGIGVAIDAGGVRGGGFLTFGENRYSGVLELSVFSVVVKAFGLIETRLPDGSPGFSFVIVIVAEFTPIQLGFGFTLLGVGGLLGVNRSVDAQALGDAVRTGSLEHLLFPRNPVQDAPAIINDLATVFPAASGHFIIGPMAKLGWGTPTLISADLGIVLAFPGPRIAVLGVLRMLLPSPEAPLVRFQLAVVGLLDFPAKLFSLDASLFDSTIAGYEVSGDMAYRMGFGSNPAFLLSVGGFNSGFPRPPSFPELRRVSVELGVNGNPSLVASGYFALTSNTAQIGASLELRASGAGIRLNGWLGFDVLFVFSPFSFSASISAGVRVSFHGVGFGITLRGTLSGPTPWHLRGKVCVSVLWWDACLPIDVRFGRAEPAALPEMDPWEGSPPEVTDERAQVIGLREAIEDARNWEGSAPPAGFAVVSLASAASASRTPIDPLGAATLRQKVAPLGMELEKFGEYRPIIHTRFDVTLVVVNGIAEDDITVVEDDFAPAHFLELSGSERLSMPSYDKMVAGISIAPDRVTQGTVGSKTLEYETAFITAGGERFADGLGDARFKLSHEQLLAQLERSASALAGVRRAGDQRYLLPPGRAKKVVLGPATFVVADACSLAPSEVITGTAGTRTRALLALHDHVRRNPGDAKRFTIVPLSASRSARAQGATSGGSVSG